ncbi:autotransporter outer membrane beta-barrel domain-containing protein [Rahnella sp. BCC 1045]|uniref:autotransporter outer membrane beta-barrel domain-containing protein n=1 Tax=Rahnella sp. BCC 1045 TaxID=2816251 RepID=UPI001C279BAA|nr:autotransporter outer membrane beta-barrel domain-containing protein [Rahnella sp. BCC 1045]MBU9818358.1 autotransporter outer membrane beta-barrel domain-containing protein [Rahnella sp. BCC 1045]
MAFAILGQSIGGGGGIGGATQAATANDKTPNSVIEASIAVGGADAANGSGGKVTITNNNSGEDISTAGDLSFGIYGQSIANGGGIGGESMTSNGVATSLQLTLGDASDKGDSGKGGEVDMTNASLITTTGDNAIGMFGQSVGGGGGLAVVTGQELDSTTGLSYSTTQSLATGSVAPQINTATLGKNNTGGDVNLNLNTGGAVNTSGINAFGIFGQSVGGGGGLIVIDPNNPVTVAGLAPAVASLLPPNLDDAGQVIVTTQTNTSITTSGDGAAGIVAQSLGGGGAMVNGLNGINLMNAVQFSPVSRSNIGSGNDITVNNSSDITTTGAYAHGIFAQAASGTGGAIGRSDGTGTLFGGMATNMGCSTPIALGGNCGGAVSVNLQAGTVAVSGLHSWGVALESQNVSYTDKDVDESSATVTVSSDARVIASGQADGAILLNSSGTNKVTNSGVIDGSGSKGGYAIYQGDSKYVPYTVINEAGGIIEGSFASNCKGNCNDTAAADSQTLSVAEAAPQTSSIINQGLIASGDIVDLNGGTLENSGILMVQGTKTGVTVLNGDYKGAGKISFDADYSHGTGDSLAVSGQADVSGTVDINPVTMHKTQVAFLTAEKGLTLSDNVSVTSSELFTTQLEQKANTLYATPEAHFSEKAATMDAASRTVADHLQSLFDAGVDMDDSYTSLAKVGSQSEYSKALHSITGRTLGSIGAFRFQSSRDFVNNLNQGCDRSNMVEGNCTWGRVQASGGHQEDTQGSLGYDATAVTYEVGIEHAITDQLTAGVAIGYERSNFEDDEGLGNIDGNSVLLGTGLTYGVGPYTLSGALDAAYGSYQSSRAITVGDQQAKADANPEVWNAGLHLKASYTENMGKSYIRPFVELQGVQVHGSGYTEHGNSSFNLAVDEQSKFSLSEGAGVEFGRHVPLRNGAELSVYVNSAIETTDGTNWETRAKFADSPSSDKFDVATNVPSTYGRFGAGVKLTKWDNVDLTLSYNPEIGSGYHSNNAIARVDWKF